MHCPFCGHSETKVIDSRLAGEGRQIRRRRECLECTERFTTFETAELLLPTVVKGDRSREPFAENKLRAGMQKALEKRPVSREATEAAAARICHKLRSLGEREIASRSPDAIRAAKRLLNLGAASDAAALLAAETAEQERLIGSANQVEAVRANLENRPPRFVDPAPMSC